MFNSNCCQPGLQEPGALSKTTFSSNTEASSSVVTENDGKQVTVTARLSSSYSYSETRYTPSAPPPAVTYAAPQQLPAGNDSAPGEATTLNSQSADTTATVNTDPVIADRNPGAATILAFVEQRLATDVADGFTQEELQSRIQAGFDGFMQGYTEAVEQLQSMGLYEGAVKDAVEQTFNQVMSGMGELADKYGLENPAADIELYELPAEAAPVTADSLPTDNSGEITAPVQAFEPFVAELTENQEARNFETLIAPSQAFYTRMEEEQSESRLYSLSLKTQDGDVVTIRSYADQGTLQRTTNDSNGLGDTLETDAMEDFRFSVEGDLDIEEMGAIKDLLAQLNDVADEFFEGDIYQAFEKAQDVGFNADEIAQFSLNLRQTEYSRIEHAYGSVAQADTDRLSVAGENQHIQGFDNRVGRMSDFIQQLQDLRTNAMRNGFAERDLPGMAEFVGRPKHGHHPHFGHLKPFMGDMMHALRSQHT